MSSSARAALLRALLSEEGLDRAGETGIEPSTADRSADDSAATLLSAAQQRMWFLQEAAPARANYNLAGSVDLHGPCDTAAVTESLRIIVDRHHILRTAYRPGTVSDEPPPERPGSSGAVAAFSLPTPRQVCAVVDATTTSPDDIAELIRQRAREPFDLASAPPIRFVLFALGPQHHRLLIVAHHIAVDFASFDIVLDELSVLYRTAAADRATILAPLPVQYADYARWEQDRFEQAHRPQLEYWAKVLSSAPPALSLPLDRARPPVLSSDGARRSRALPPELADRIRARARESGATTWMALLAAVTVLMHRYSSDDDIAIGAPVSLRDRPEVATLIGNFVNTVVLRTDLSGEPDFAEVVRRTAQTCNAAFAHQDVPFDRVVETTAPPRSASRTPFFDVMCSYRAGLPHDIDAGELRIAPPDTVNETARFDLVFEFTDDPAELDVALIYRTELFDSGTADRILGHLHVLLESAVTEYDSAPVGDLELLEAAERDLVLHQWSRSTDLPVPDVPVHQLIAQVAADAPDRPAIVSATETLTYAQLNARADALARHLLDAGVEPEHTIGIAMQRSADQVVAVLAALKSGGSFVPLDPDWPPDRHRRVLDDAGIGVVLADTAEYRDRVARDRSVVLCPAHLTDPPTGTSRTLGEVSPTGMAYVIFTSGSTGEPKGAMLTHRAIGFRLRWQADLLRLGPTDAILYKAPLSFDISVNEMLLPLVAGARLVVAEPGRDGDPGYLLEVIERERVTFFYVVASVLDVMLDHPRFTRAMSGLTHLWCGGEALTSSLYERFRAACRATMYNGYGPAETTIGVAHRVYDRTDDDPRITIGRPNPNSRIYLLDADQHPAPVGVVGEIHIGGVQLARGYINRPVETADRFLPDPFSDEAGARLYRTGDLARFCADGEIEFVGRVDNQVKVRGFRVELGEIEAVLGRHPAVRQVAVLVEPDPAGRNQLVGFIAPLAETAVTEAEVKHWLRTRLPEYMVPNIFEILPALPLTGAGKTDRRALAGSRSSRPAPTAAELPRTEWQIMVAECWRTVLGADSVDVHTNFFEAGGHSLLLASMQPILARRTGRDVSIVDLFAYPTIAALAEWLQSQQQSGDTAPDDYVTTAHRHRADRQRAARRAHQERRNATREGSNDRNS